MYGNVEALFNPETSIQIQKRPFYSGNQNSETPGDSKNAFLHWGDVLVLFMLRHSSSRLPVPGAWRCQTCAG